MLVYKLCVVRECVKSEVDTLSQIIRESRRGHSTSQ